MTSTQINTTIREITARRIVEDRRRDLVCMKWHLDEEVLEDVRTPARLEKAETDLTSAIIFKWLERIERGLDTTVAELADVINGEATP